MSSIRLALLAFALLALAVPAPARAQVGEQKEMASFVMTGAVKAVDAAKRTITVEGANKEGGVLEVDPKAMLKNGDKGVALADVKVGWRVVVNGDTRAGKRVVTYLEVVETE